MANISSTLRVFRLLEKANKRRQDNKLFDIEKYDITEISYLHLRGKDNGYKILQLFTKVDVIKVAIYLSLTLPYFDDLFRSFLHTDSRNLAVCSAV